MFFNYYDGDHDEIKHFTFGNWGGRGGKWAKFCGDEKYNSMMEELLKKNNGKFYELSHHMSHAANAFFSSNFDDAFNFDDGWWWEEGFEEVTAFTVYTNKGNKIKKIKVWDINDLNIGGAWNKVLKEFGLSVGYPHGNQSGTLMAMACMGSGDKWIDDFYKSNQNKFCNIFSQCKS